MIIVTGGAGMIGSNLIKALNSSGEENIILVDDLTNGKKVVNISDLKIYDFIDKNSFIEKIINDKYFEDSKIIFHLGACSATTNWDGRYLMENNYEYSKILLNWSQRKKIPFIYASSASVYGLGINGFEEKLLCEDPINMYAYSKFLFDQYVRRIYQKRTTQIVGLRYFNVYGPREQHKNSMASTIYHFNNQIEKFSKCKLFVGIDGYKNGEQKRDFVYVKDCVAVKIWLMENKSVSGIFNVGTGKTHTFNEVAESVINWHKKNFNTHGQIEYIDFPNHLVGSYQSFTKANINNLRDSGYKDSFMDVSQGVSDYLNCLYRI